MKSAGYQFVIAKATEGSEAGSKYLDPNFKGNIAGANDAGIMTHAYHYFLGISEQDARAEAQWFIKNLAGVPVKGYLFVDVEDKSLDPDPATLTGYVNAFLDELAKVGYTKLGIYSGLYFMKDRLVESQLRPGILKWIAQYNSTFDRTADVWQHTSSASVPGIAGNVDENIAYTDKLVAPGVPVVALHPAPAAPASSVIYTVQLGETLSGIASAHGTTVSALAAINGISNPNFIRAGQVLRLPGGGGQPASRPVHVVVSGDTLWGISQANHTSVAALKSINHLSGDTIYPGQKLYLR